ncbi:MAG: protein kinase [Acidobacteriota bacterium]|nr:protein kinase [Acidobacteriota bacterium]
MADDTLLSAAGRIADGEQLDWGSITSSLPSDDERAVAEELAVVAQIAAGHRQLHQLLPVSADTPPNLMPDRARWGHLDLLNIVGRGSYGTVYRAWDTRLERLVALKLFHGASDPDSVMQEGRMLARVRHEHVVTVYGADVVDGVAGLWMELVHGETLEHLVKARGPMSAIEAATLGADVAAALGAVHAAGLLHCDIKAQNVVQESGGRVVLMDLGAGRVVPEAQDSDQLSDVAGTPRYMAPELFHAGATSTKSTDIYSFGVMLYYLVSGSFPVDGKSLGELKRAHQELRVHALDQVRAGLPPAFLDLVARALHRDPAQRPSSAMDVQSALAAIAAPMAAPAPEPRSVGWWAAVAAVVGLLALVVVRPFFTPAAPPAPEVRSIAVLPIKNLTGDPSKQYLADGLTEVLITHLARLPGLTIISSETIATLRGSADESRAMAERLGVRLLLAGSVVQADGRIALSVKLVDPFQGRTVWGTELERQPSTILSARSEIARLVAARLELQLDEGDRADLRERALQPEAQEAFLRGLVEAASGSAARVPIAVAHFEEAVRREPTWAEPLAHLAYAQQRAIESGDPLGRSARAEIVRTNALRAIELDAHVATSYTALAAVQAYHDWDFSGAEATLRQGLAAVAQNGAARSRLALLLAAEGRLPEAIAEAEAARDAEPLIPERHTTLGIIRYYANDFDRALDDMERSLSIAPNYGQGHLGKGRVLSGLGRYDEAIREVQLALDQAPNPGWLAVLGNIYAMAGRFGEMSQVESRLRDLEKQGVFAGIDTYAYNAAYQGRFDEAFTLLDEAVRRRLTNVLWVAVDPRAGPLRRDPRFDQLVIRMGVAAR